MEGNFNNDRNKQLLERQLLDILSQADKILTGQNSAEAIETFSKYSEELKKYIAANFTEPELLEKAKQIETIHYKRNKIKLWHIATLSFWIIALMQYIATQKSIEEIGRVKSDWATFYMLYKTQL